MKLEKTFSLDTTSQRVKAIITQRIFQKKEGIESFVIVPSVLTLVQTSNLRRLTAC